MDRPGEPTTLLILLAPTCGIVSPAALGARPPRREPRQPPRGRFQELRAARCRRRFGAR
ncbi:MAG TPA: hypothetical protein PLU22_22315 [Polyangiaceae bacterium]|nr:hypothetical protein [Polyangiaceae bacterium]